MGAYLPPDIYVRYRKLKMMMWFLYAALMNRTAIEMASVLENVSPQEIIDRYHFSNKKAFKISELSLIFSRTSL